MIAIVNYGAGNLNSVKKAFDYLGAENAVTNKPELVLAAEKIILARGGAFFLAPFYALFRVARSVAKGAFRGKTSSWNLPGNAMAFRRQ